MHLTISTMRSSGFLACYCGAYRAQKLHYFPAMLLEICPYPSSRLAHVIFDCLEAFVFRSFHEKCD